MQKVTFQNRELSTWDLAKLTNRAAKTIWLDACAGKVPGCVMTPGGHYHFKDGKPLREYIAQRKKNDAKGRRVLPPYVEAMGKIGVLERFIEKHTWDKQQKELLKQQLGSVIMKLAYGV